MQACRVSTFILLCCLAGNVLAADGIPVITYHDIVEKPGPDRYAVNRRDFVRQMQYLREQGFHPVSLAQLQRARLGKGSLPDKPVILTFDDGLVSYRDVVAPILNRYRFPSVLSIVSGWVDGVYTPPEYRGKLLNWKQIQALSESPWVEIASHSHDLHRWLPEAHGGSAQPAAVIRIWQQAQNRPEDDDQYRRRIRADLTRSMQRFVKVLGKRPLALTWPYGRYTQDGYRIASKAGYRLQLTLDEGLASLDELPRVRRYLVLRDTGLDGFKSMVSRAAVRRARQQRFVSVDLQVFEHVDAENHERLIGQMVERIGSLGVNMVIVLPFYRDGSKAFFRSRYFGNSPDILGRLQQQLRDRLNIYQTYIRLPEATQSLPTAFYVELARNYEFSGLLLEGDVGRARLGRVRRQVRREQPNARVGLWKPKTPGGDVSVVDSPVATQKGTRIMVYVDEDRYFTTGGLAEALRALRKQGVDNYGYGPLNYMAGPQAPAQLVEAMGPRLDLKAAN